NGHGASAESNPIGGSSVGRWRYRFVLISGQRDSGARVRGWIRRLRQRMARGLRCLSSDESSDERSDEPPNRRSPDRIAWCTGRTGDDIDEARAAGAGTLLRLGVARAGSLDYSWHGGWTHLIAPSRQMNWKAN